MKKLSRIFTVSLAMILIALTLAVTATAYPTVGNLSLTSPIEPTATPEYKVQLPLVFKNK